jgi:NAD(P)H dehydrogenase (quinone)
MTQVLLLYYSKQGSLAGMTEQIARGVESYANVEAVIRTLPRVSTTTEGSEPAITEQGPQYASLEDLKSCDGLILGSPSYFGNMAAEVKHFLDQTTPLWLSGALIGKPAGVYTSSSSLHGGQESVLLSMMQPLLHHGMLISGIPYSEPAIHNTLSGGTPYGASHFAHQQQTELSEDEISACHALGHRIAELAHRLKQSGAGN